MSRKQLEYLLVATTWVALIAVAGLFPAGCTERGHEPTFAGHANAKEFFDRKDREAGGGGAPWGLRC